MGAWAKAWTELSVQVHDAYKRTACKARVKLGSEQWGTDAASLQGDAVQGQG